MKLSLVIPAYNESVIIKDTARAALDRLGGVFDGFELIIVDDGSQDGTAEAAANIGADALRVISYPENRGKGHAVKAGMLAATGDAVFFTDADLAYGLDVVELGARTLLETGCDVLSGSRRLERGGYGEYPALRIVMSKGFSLVSRLASGMRYDTQCGIKGFTAHAAQELFGKCETGGFAFDFEVMLLADRLGYKVTQMPVTIINHRDSRVAVARDSLRMMREIIAIRKRIRRST